MNTSPEEEHFIRTFRPEIKRQLLAYNVRNVNKKLMYFNSN